MKQRRLRKKKLKVVIFYLVNCVRCIVESKAGILRKHEKNCKLKTNPATTATDYAFANKHNSVLVDNLADVPVNK